MKSLARTVAAGPGVTEAKYLHRTILAVRVGIAGVTLFGALVFGQAFHGNAKLGIGLILAGAIMLNALSCRPRQAGKSRSASLLL